MSVIIYSELLKSMIKLKAFILDSIYYGINTGAALGLFKKQCKCFQPKNQTKIYQKLRRNFLIKKN